MREVERQEDRRWRWAVEVCVFEERRAGDISDGSRNRFEKLGPTCARQRCTELRLRSLWRNVSCKPCAWVDVRFASWGSFGGELPGLDDPCIARTMLFRLVVARPLYGTVSDLVPSPRYLSIVVRMALQPPSPPTFQEALKNDRAQFEDCTPCRIVGTAPSSTLVIRPSTNTHSHTQEVQHSLASVPSRTFPVIHKSKPTKPRYEPAKASLA
jgi:hypothetical protein